MGFLSIMRIWSSSSRSLAVNFDRAKTQDSRIRAALGLLVLVAVLTVARAQNAPATGQYRIAGQVVNATSGEPVARVTVAALAQEDSHIVGSAQSDADGRFMLESLPAGKYPLTASKRGLRTAFYDEHDEFNSAIVTGPGQDTSHLVFRLMPGGVLRGVVTADGGDPAENANVILFKRDPGAAHGQGFDDMREADATMTDDTGAYEFSNLVPGEYFVAVNTSPWYSTHRPTGMALDAATGDSPLDVAYPVTFFDSTTEETSASPIQIEPGAREEANISLHAVPALRLQVPVPRKGPREGVARTELRQMIFGVQVSAQSSGVGDPTQLGIAEFNGVAPGHYELMQGDPPRIVELNASSSETVDAGAGTLAVEVTGILRSTTGAPVPANVDVMLEPVGGQGRVGMQMNAHKGEFRFDAVAPGVWSVTASAQGNPLPVVSIASGGTPVAGNQITIRDRAVSLVATVSPSLLRVQGFARKDGKGFAGAMIVLVPRQPSAYRALVRRDQSDSDGSFMLREVPAGQYTVIALEDAWKMDWTDREKISRYLPGGIPVTVSGVAGAKVSLSGPVGVQAR